jgi:methylenetetrahydrofolate reductase (NADPH)
MNEHTSLKTRAFASDLAASPFIDWISVTDNGGGNPQLAPLAL